MIFLGEFLFSTPRIATKNTHGTGCTLASAIAAGIAKKLSLEDAVAQAKDYLQKCLKNRPSTEVYALLGEVFEALEDKQAALDSYKSGLKDTCIDRRFA